MDNSSLLTRSSPRLMTALTLLILAGCSSSPSNPPPSAPIEQKPSGIQAGMLIGGATKEIKEGVQPVGGFLPHPELLAPGGPGRPALVYFNREANPSTYRKVLLDPVTVWAGPNSSLRKAPLGQQRDLANLFYSDLYNALKTKCAMVRTAGPNTIHFQVALVDTKEPRAGLNTVATYAPYVSTAYSVSSHLFNKGVGYFAGTATVEAYALDAASGTLLWEAVDKRGGTAALAANTLDNWRDVRHAFEAWGAQMRTRLQEVGVCHK
jgi:hypothetical protein